MTRDAQVQYIKDNYLSIPAKRMAKQIGRSGCFVFGIMKKHNLIVPDDTKIRFRNTGAGREPFNKGLKQSDYLTPEQIEKSKATRFSKGHTPHNTKKDLDLSIRNTKGYPYYWIRIKLAKWELLHRYIWKKYHGDIPPGHNVQFKDGNSLNCEIDNLYLIHRKSQAIINKTGGKSIPQELHNTILLINQLKIQINEKQDH